MTLKYFAKFCLLYICLVISNAAAAQENKLDENHFGFESEEWTSGEDQVLSITSDKSASGSFSLKYQFPDGAVPEDNAGLYSIETGYTISKVRSAKNDDGQYIVASSFEGTVLGVSYDGVILWKNELSGFMNRDLWAGDLNADGVDEILTANSDGHIYCLDHNGELIWQFKKNDAPMNSVCVVTSGVGAYVAAGGYDKSLYFLNSQGKELKEIQSPSYSIDRPWGRPAPIEGTAHIANFLRPFKKSDGQEGLVMAGAMHTAGNETSLYLFDILADQPYKSIKVPGKGSIGHMDVVDTDQDGADEFLLGTNGFITGSQVHHVKPDEDKIDVLGYENLRTKISGFGYRVTMCTAVPAGNSFDYFIMYGSDVLLADANRQIGSIEVLNSKYSYNDMWKVSDSTILVASSQSGGSSIQVIHLNESKWKDKYKELLPPGKLQTMVEDGEELRAMIQNFQKPTWERENRRVRMLTEHRTGIEEVINYYQNNYDNPVFYLNKQGRAENWDRSAMGNATYQAKRDGRQRYEWTQQQVLDYYEAQYDGEYGISFWGGHGTDPYIYSKETVKKIIDIGNAEGKATNVTYPELEAHDADAAWMLNDLIYPLAEYARDKNTTLYIRTKHTFWNSIIYKPLWSRLLSGEFADVFIPSMEETNSKMMDMSIASRLGIWMSGAVNEWGSRCARDNTSYDRLREVSHQMLPNHFLRQTIYHLSQGATNQNNFPVDQRYYSMIYDMIRKGVIYIPNRDEIVSISPVHLSMLEPSDEWIVRNNEVKWIVKYDEDEEEQNPAVISRGGGAWPGAPVKEWDYSRYAAGSKERRLESFPTFENGIVLFTPPQSGIHANLDAPRGKLTDHMHPIYKDIMKEYFTDGDHYYSADGTQTYNADEYYTTIENDIKMQAEKLPLTVTGRVAWVTAQTDPKHLRLTLIDGGYINPDKRIATVSFHTTSPVKMTDLLSGELIDITNPSNVEIEIPVGGVKFIDIEINSEL